MSHRRVILLVVALTAAVWPAVAGAGPAQLPNLVPLPPFDVHVGGSDDGAGTALRFGVSTANRGDQALDLLGVPDGPNQVSTAHQCVSWAAPRACLLREAVGKFVYHPAHGHYHFEDYALYELRALLPDGLPDMSEAGLVATGGKASFCLLDYDSDGPPPHPAYEFPHPLYLTCASSITGTGFQGISPGWKDTYVSSLDGQQIIIDGIPDGRYAVVVTADPDNRLRETTNADNVAFTAFDLVAGRVTLL